MKQSMLAVLVTMITFAPASMASDLVDIGSRRELFVDDAVVEKLTHTALKLHHPQYDGVALEFDKPWEGAFCGYATVIKDGDVFRMYYRGLPVAGQDGSAAETTCYAESKDGKTWTKPDLGLFEINGTRDNNVVLADVAPLSHNFSPFLDTRAGVSTEHRYKGVGGTRGTGLVAFISPDGKRWTKLRDEPIITKGAFDSQNVVFWSEHEQKYLCYLRTFKNGVRWITRTTSEDFINWTEPVDMTFGDAPNEHLYTNQTRPYFRAPHIYLATAARFMPGRKILTPEQAKAVGVDPGYFNDCSDVVLLSTRGGNIYHRTFLESFIRPGTGLEHWSSRTNYPAYGIVPLDESTMAIHVQKAYAQPTHRIVRYILRTDGFVSVNAPYSGGEFLTKPLHFSGKNLTINYATSAPGFIRVEIQTSDGSAVSDFALADCQEIIGDEIERVVSWKGGADVSKLAGKPIRLRFVMKDADLYALRFK
jgi:hypothetical protein